MTVAIGELLKHLREDRSWSQADLAQRSSVAQSQIAALETGKTTNPTDKTVKRLAAAFEMEEIAFRALAAKTDQLLAAELRAAGEPDERVQRLLRLWPRLSEKRRDTLLRIALDLIEEDEQYGGAGG